MKKHFKTNFKWLLLTETRARFDSLNRWCLGGEIVNRTYGGILLLSSWLSAPGCLLFRCSCIAFVHCWVSVWNIPKLLMNVGEVFLRLLALWGKQNPCLDWAQPFSLRHLKRRRTLRKSTYLRSRLRRRIAPAFIVIVDNFSNSRPWREQVESLIHT